MIGALPDHLSSEVDRLFEQYALERARRPEEQTGQPSAPLAVNEIDPEPDERADDRATHDLDEGGSESFFA